ncbi:hypothetical protein HY045_00380 [Candidatus Woesebacteria bacterium]|nr:hypothetical protein [Candidatus Woesebacteria bacterium]
MKKYLPVGIFLVGLLVFGGVFLMLRGSSSKTSNDQQVDEAVPEITLTQRPVTSLTPSGDGHWLKMKIDSIKVKAATLDYELLYSLPDGRSQGVPGTVNLNGKTSVSRDLLLGSESSGHFRYDEGVDQGALTVRFRNDSGKLVGKLSTKFHLQSKVAGLASVDGKFTFKLNKTPTKDFYVTMETFGLPNSLSGGLSSGPYGVFSSAVVAQPGTVTLDGTIQRATSGGWEEVKDGKASDIGIFVGTK